MNIRIKSLCKRAKKGNKDAACQLVKIYYADIYAHLRRLCGSKQDAEDLTQQTFIKVWFSLDGFKGHSRFSTWLYRVAHNTFLDWLRKNTASTQSSSDQWWNECIDQNPGPFANVSERQLAERLYEAVEQLDEGKKHVVLLHYYQGLSIRETAKVLNVATSTVKYRLREGFKILRVKSGLRGTGFEQKRTTPIAKENHYEY
jgi:RNA polymerase sigma-70 factor (ECF subfamily)